MALLRTTRLCLRALLVIALAVVSGATGSAAQQDEVTASFYRGQVLRLVVGYGAGGGYDAYARLLAPHLEQRLEATVVVENQVGGGGLVALNRLAAGTPDGLTIMLANGEGAALAQLLGQEGVRYDLAELIMLGRVAGEPRVLLVTGEGPFESLVELINTPRPFQWAASGKTDGLGDSAAFASAALGIPAQIVIGYKGAKEAALSVMRGETDGITPSASSARQYARDGALRPLAVLAREPAEAMPDVPTVFELLELTAEQSWWIDYRAQFSDLGRILVAPPGVPLPRQRELRRAIHAVLNDPEVIAEAERVRRPLRYAPGEQLRGILERSLLAVDEARLGQLREIVLERYY